MPKRTVHNVQRYVKTNIKSLELRLKQSNTPKHVIVDHDRNGKMIDWLYARQQTAQSMLKILGYTKSKSPSNGSHKTKAIKKSAMESSQLMGLFEDELKDISTYINSIYPKYNIKEKSFATLLALMQSDKKNEDGEIMFSLLDKIGECAFNCRVTKADILSSLTYYNNL